MAWPDDDSTTAADDRPSPPPTSLPFTPRLPIDINQFLPPPPQDTPPPTAPPPDKPSRQGYGEMQGLANEVLGPPAPKPQAPAVQPAAKPGVSSLTAPPARPSLQDPGFPQRPTAGARPEPPTPKYRDSLMALTNPLMIIPLMASLFTRNSAVAAGNAMAAAIEAQKKGDMDAYQDEREVYAQNLAKWQREDAEQKTEYENIIEDRRLSLDERNSRLRMAAHRRGDPIMLAELDANGNPQAVVDARSGPHKRVSKAMEDDDFKRQFMKDNPDANRDDAEVALLQHKAMIKARAKGVPEEQAYIDSYIATHPGATYADAKASLAKNIAKAKAEGTAAGKGVTPNKAADIQIRITNADEALSKIDKIMSTLQKYQAAAGLAGKVFRGVEAVGNISGATAETDRVQMRRDISELQSLYPRITGGTGRPLAMDSHRVEDIIGGLATGDTTANTIRSMQEAQETIMRFRKAYQDTLGRTGGTPAPAEPAAPAPAPTEGNPWDAFPSR
jgi:hypothetical protein